VGETIDLVLIHFLCRLWHNRKYHAFMMYRNGPSLLPGVRIAASLGDESMANHYYKASFPFLMIP
jgi:hypothetical protein